MGIWKDLEEKKEHVQNILQEKSKGSYSSEMVLSIT